MPVGQVVERAARFARLEQVASRATRAGAEVERAGGGAVPRAAIMCGVGDASPFTK